LNSACRRKDFRSEMGRILKKKDPDKKKAQRIARAESDASAPQSAIKASPDKPPTQVLKKSNALSAKPKIMPKAGPLEKNFVQRSVQFLREVKIELKKVTWPTRKQTMGSTAVVLILVMIISVFLGIVDFGLSSLVRVVLP
jgi:preprotein translocase subunit SecE